MNIESFIFVHNQDIILDCIHSNKFSILSNLKYVFVGNGDTTLPDHQIFSINHTKTIEKQELQNNYYNQIEIKNKLK
jgi:hypothetical protein